MIDLIKSVIKAFQIHQMKEAISLSTPHGCQAQLNEEPPIQLLQLPPLHLITEELMQKQLADAHEAAAAEEGPQPWERDWIEYEVYMEDEIRKIATNIGWHRTQDFLTVLNMALASPQGQRALAEVGEETSFWQGELQLIQELRRGLVTASHDMLCSHATGLGYSIDAIENLSETFDNR